MVTHTGMRPSHTLVEGMDSASVVGQDPPLSDQAPSDHQLDVSIHSVETEPKSNCMRTHLGQFTLLRRCYHPNFGPDQLLPTSDKKLSPRMKSKGFSQVSEQDSKSTAGIHCPPGQGRHQLPQGSNEIFYSTDRVLAAFDPPNTKTVVSCHILCIWL